MISRLLAHWIVHFDKRLSQMLDEEMPNHRDFHVIWARGYLFGTLTYHTGGAWAATYTHWQTGDGFTKREIVDFAKGDIIAD